MTILNVPGASLYCECEGAGPLLLLIGSPMGSAGFAGLVPFLAGEYTVVTYDPRGISKSTREDKSEDVSPERLADDVLALIEAAGSGPAHIFGSSGGAITGLALVARHPEAVGTLIAHEPPLTYLLPDASQQDSEGDELYDVWRDEGVPAAIAKFFADAGFGDEMPPLDAEAIANWDMFFGHIMRGTGEFRPDIATLRGARIVVAAGEESEGEPAHRAAVAFAGELGAEVVKFPGDHGSFTYDPEPVARAIRDVLVV